MPRVVAIPGRGWLELDLLQAVRRAGTAPRRALDRRQLVERRCRKDRAGGICRGLRRATIAALGLGAPVPADLQAAQERAIDAGHCNALPPSTWPRMARAQFARDAVMAEALRLGAPRGRGRAAGGEWTCAPRHRRASLARRREEQGVRRRLPRDHRRHDPRHGLRRRGADRSGRTPGPLCGVQETRRAPSNRQRHESRR